MSLRFNFQVTLSHFLLLSSLVSGRCWYPDGKTAAPLDVPCSNSGNATCCGRGYACLSNNICMATKDLPNPPTTPYIRGSCTDPTWNSANCPTFCDNPAIGDKEDGGIGMAKCPNSDTLFYCMDSSQADVDCTHTKSVLIFAAYTTVTVIPFGGTAAASSSITSSTTSSSSSTISKTSATSSSTQASSNTPIPLATAPISKDSSSNLSTAIGAGLGVPLGLIAIAIACYLYFRYRQGKKATSAKAQMDVQSGPSSWSQDAKWQQQVSHPMAPGELGMENNSPHELPAETPRV